uniref:Uncharacterized protein n=1 Tax=Parascaris univalens TaxID=6257 RepID=A0A915BQP8_PARUN
MLTELLRCLTLSRNERASRSLQFPHLFIVPELAYGRFLSNMIVTDG